MARANYTAARKHEDEVIYRALQITERRLKEPGPQATKPAVAADLAKLRLSGLDVEVFAAFFLDSQHCLISFEILAKGTINEACVYAREVIKRALANNAVAVIFAHNHPSGNSEASWADRALTSKLKDVLALIDVKVLDHFVIGSGKPFSFSEHGWL